jgi:hypothetical protein
MHASGCTACCDALIAGYRAAAVAMLLSHFLSAVSPQRHSKVHQAVLTISDAAVASLPTQNKLGTPSCTHCRCCCCCCCCCCTTLHHRYTKLYSHLWERYSTAAADAAAAAAAGGSAQRLPPPPELSLVHDCSIAQLLQPDMTADAVQVGGTILGLCCLRDVYVAWSCMMGI